MGPLIPQGIITGDWDFVIALLLGIAFGFILEASGFSSSRNITGAFYGYNFVVLRVFFTAVLVAMIGLLYFDYLGWINMDMLYILPTFLTPMIIGGIVMGFGFVIGGFCPGTSYTAIAIGKIDAMVFTGGLFLGIFIFSETFPLFSDFYYSTNMGNITISEMLGISNAVFTFIMVVIGMAAFWGTWIIEKRVRKNINPYKFE